MGKDILVKMEIPFEPVTLKFNKWLPIREENKIVIEDQDKRIVLWFDINCARTSEETDEEILRFVNIPVRKIYVETTIKNVCYELIEHIIYISDNLKSLLRIPDSRPSNSTLYENYEHLGKKVLEISLKYVNRLISYARIHNGQYRLEQIKIDSANMGSVFRHFGAKVHIDNKWYDWHPSFIGGVYFVESNFDGFRSFNLEDWEGVKQFIMSDRSPNLVYELLANAELLATSGFRRNALIDAITALEVMVSTFSKHPYIEKLDSISNINNRLHLKNLKSTVEHLGFSSTVNYLLPLIFNEDKLPFEMIQNCQEAISERQLIVHTGKRDIEFEKIKTFLIAIRNLCFLLKEFSLPN